MLVYYTFVVLSSLFRDLFSVHPEVHLPLGADLPQLSLSPSKFLPSGLNCTPCVRYGNRRQFHLASGPSNRLNPLSALSDFLIGEHGSSIPHFRAFVKSISEFFVETCSSPPRGSGPESRQDGGGCKHCPSCYGEPAQSGSHYPASPARRRTQQERSPGRRFPYPEGRRTQGMSRPVR